MTISPAQKIMPTRLNIYIPTWSKLNKWLSAYMIKILAMILFGDQGDLQTLCLWTFSMLYMKTLNSQMLFKASFADSNHFSSEQCNCLSWICSQRSKSSPILLPCTIFQLHTPFENFELSRLDLSLLLLERSRELQISVQNSWLQVFGVASVDCLPQTSPSSITSLDQLFVATLGVKIQARYNFR